MQDDDIPDFLKEREIKTNRDELETIIRGILYVAAIVVIICLIR